jgi:hypothetical protein
MAIQISGTNVIDNSRNLVNTVNITASGTINGGIVATKAQAETGTDNTKLMTPLRVAEAIAALGGQVINRIQRGSTVYGSGSNIATPITTVDLGKSFVSQGDRQDGAGDVEFGSIVAAAIGGGGSARLTSATTLTISSPPGVNLPFLFIPNSGTVDWEVIEFK